MLCTIVLDTETRTCLSKHTISNWWRAWSSVKKKCENISSETNHHVTSVYGPKQHDWHSKRFTRFDARKLETISRATLLCLWIVRQDTDLDMSWHLLIMPPSNAGPTLWGTGVSLILTSMTIFLSRWKHWMQELGITTRRWRNWAYQPRDSGGVKEIGRTYSWNTADTPELNATSERKFRTLNERCLSMLLRSGLSVDFWWDAYEMSSYITNRMPTKTAKVYMTPHEGVYQEAPDIENLRVWGCKTNIRVPRNHHRNDWCDKLY